MNSPFKSPPRGFPVLSKDEGSGPGVGVTLRPEGVTTRRQRQKSDGLDRRARRHVLPASPRGRRVPSTPVGQATATAPGNSSRGRAGTPTASLRAGTPTASLRRTFQHTAGVFPRLPNGCAIPSRKRGRRWRERGSSRLLSVVQREPETGVLQVNE